MPYPTEHSARLKSPGSYIRFRRQNDKFGPGIHAIFGVTKAGKAELQAIRFDRKKFTVAQAKAWLKAHKHKPIKFEPASTTASLAAAKFKFNCECIKCGHKIKTNEHCAKLKCTKCGGQMRRVERPGPGQPGAELAGVAKGVEVLRVGSFQGSKGPEVVVTGKGLDALIRNFAANPDVPLIVGHDVLGKVLKANTDTPAAGWVSRFYRQGKKLLADIVDIPEVVGEWIASKAFRKVSMGLSRVKGKGGIEELVARHIGLLGAKPPAVDGLADFPQVEFTFDLDPTVIEFTKGEISVDRKKALEVLRKAGLDEKLFGEGVPDATVIALAEKTQAQADSTAAAEKTAEEAKATAVAADKRADEAEAKVKAAEEEEEDAVPTAEAAMAKATEAKEAAEKAVAKAELAHKEIEKRLVSERAVRAESLADRLIEEGRMSPAEKDGWLSVALAHAGGNGGVEVELASADGKTKEKLDTFEAHLQLADRRPKIQVFGEVGEEGGPTSDEAKEKATVEAGEYWLEHKDDLKSAYTREEFVVAQLASKGFKVEKKTTEGGK